MSRKNIFFSFLFSILAVFIFNTCGLPEVFYLPSVPAISIPFVSGVEFDLPEIPSDFSYVEKFSIFYRIYLSDAILEIVNPNDMQNISRQLSQDYNFYHSRYIDVTNPPPFSKSNFTSNNYYEIKLTSDVLKINPGQREKKISINFPVGQPAFIRNLNGNSITDDFIKRESESNFQVLPDDYFIYSTDLLIYDQTTGPGKDYNRDVFGTAGTSYTTIYVSMYIVVEGFDNTTFTDIFSIPTHIGVFRLQ